MSIVVGTDFSAQAEEAALAAAAVAGRLGVPLQLVHVRARGEDSSGSEEKLAALAGRIRTGGVDVEALLLDGSADEALVGHAASVGAELLVTTALGWRQGGKWKVGGVPERIAQTSPIPFLVVRNAAPFLAWARQERALKVTVGDDFSHVSAGAVAWVGKLRRIGPIELTIAHVYWPYTELSRLGLSLPARHEQEIEAILTRELQHHAEALGEREARFRLEPAWGRIVDPLVELASAEAADLLVLGTHQRGTFGRLSHGSVSRTALHLADMSVATVPLPEEAELVPEVIPAVSTVLVTTDFSPLANLAVPHAYSLLSGGGKVVLLHVMGPDAPRSEDAALRARLERLIPPDAQKRGISTTLELASGTQVAREVSQIAERLGADVVCIGSHGRSGVKRALLGSVAQEVLHTTTRPVMVIRPSASRNT